MHSPAALKGPLTAGWAHWKPNGVMPLPFQVLVLQLARRAGGEEALSTGQDGTQRSWQVLREQIVGKYKQCVAQTTGCLGPSSESK